MNNNNTENAMYNVKDANGIDKFLCINGRDWLIEKIEQSEDCVYVTCGTRCYYKIVPFMREDWVLMNRCGRIEIECDGTFTRFELV